MRDTGSEKSTRFALMWPGFSSLLVLVFGPRCFPPRTPISLSFKEPTFPNYNSNPVDVPF